MNRQTSTRATVPIGGASARRWISVVAAGALAASTALIPAASSQAFDPPTVIDDFEDGDANDWGFFGGNAAGGGGGVQDDRPYEGTYYLSTGWGDGGPTSTHALLPGSPAIGAADAGFCPGTDQRGVLRPQGGGCDIGSVESTS